MAVASSLVVVVVVVAAAVAACSPLLKSRHSPESALGWCLIQECDKNKWMGGQKYYYQEKYLLGTKAGAAAQAKNALE